MKKWFDSPSCDVQLPYIEVSDAHTTIQNCYGFRNIMESKDGEVSRGVKRMEKDGGET